MRTRLLTLAAALAAATVPAAPSDALVSADVTVCTSLVDVCPIQCTSDSMISVHVVGDGYGDAKCGDATAYCYTATYCSDTQYVGRGGGWIRCLVDLASLVPTVAVCTTTPFVN